MTTYTGTYVDISSGLISREIFIDEEIYKDEQERIFSNSWLFIGHIDQLKKPGDYFVSRMGEESVVMVKDRQGEVHVFLNSCRHRGMKVCRYDEGNSPVFTCPYHGWSYGLDGRLLGVPHFRDGYHGQLEKTNFGLLAARVHNYRGTIWATWSDSIPDFLDYLGDMRVFWDGMLDASDGSDDEVEVLPGVQKFVIPCNWKFVASNFIGDHNHQPSHHSVELAGIGPGGRGQTRHGNSTNRRRNLTAFPTLGHGWRGSPPTSADLDEMYGFPTFADPDIERYFQSSWEQWKANRPGEVPKWILGGGGNIFPNTAFAVRFPRTIGVAHPAGPNKTEMWRWYLVDRNMPVEVKRHLRDYMVRYSGPGGMTEQDDLENWNYATAASAGVMARRLPYCLQQGLGHWHSGEPELRGARISDDEFSDSNELALYENWARLMDGGGIAAASNGHRPQPIPEVSPA